MFFSSTNKINYQQLHQYLAHYFGFLIRTEGKLDAFVDSLLFLVGNE